MRIKTLRLKLGLNQTQMAERLGITREWLSALENGRSPVQELLVYKMDQLENSLHAPEDATIAETDAEYAQDSKQMISSARSIFEAVLALAGNDPSRLGWLIEQMKQHLIAPKHWQQQVKFDHDTNQLVQQAVQRAHENEFRSRANLEQSGKSRKSVSAK